MELHFLKMRWGDIILLKNGNDVAMVDTGHDADFEQICTYLENMGVQKLSFILLTHFHRDHYGSIPMLVKHFEVDRVYFKQYSGLDAKTSGGKPADDAYRQGEWELCECMKSAIRENSRLIPVEEIREIAFGGCQINLHAAQNSILEIYEDPSNEKFYHKISFSENQNSLAVFMKVSGVNVFLGGDVRDEAWDHPLANRVNTRIANEIGEQIDIYKVPHHGTTRCNSDEALAIYKPKIAVITNGQDFVRNNSTILQDLQRANKDVTVYLTDEQDVVISISDQGEISVNCEPLAIN